MANLVNLTPSEMLMAANAGVMRQTENIKNGLHQSHGSDIEMNWQIHIEGAMGEMALAKFLNCYWSGKGVIMGSDVGQVDVRTRSKHYYDLIIRESDPDDRMVYLLTGINGTYLVRGWIKAINGKKEEYKKDYGNRNHPAYFVPQDQLNVCF